MRESRSRVVAALILAGIAAAFTSSCASQGENLFKSRGCVNCHRFKGQGGNMGPDLTGVTSRRTDAWIIQQVHDSSKNNPASRMPKFSDLSFIEVRSLLAYLKQDG